MPHLPPTRRNPQEPAYQRLLGWTYFKKAPPEIEKAVEHLEQALALDPDDTETAYRIGMIRDAG